MSIRSLVHASRTTLESRGEYVVRANASSGWFAIFPNTWRNRSVQAIQDGRAGPNLVVFRTKSSKSRDHYVIPHFVVRPLLVDSTLTHSDASGTSRWNLTLKNDVLHVSRGQNDVDVREFYEARLITESVATEPGVVVLANEVAGDVEYIEGSVQTIIVNRYERDAKSRAACVAHHGAACQICGMNFGLVYGSRFEGFIHVHHLKPLSKIKQAYQVDPIADLRPVCPNCHAVVHQREPPYSIEEVRSMLKRELDERH